MKNSGCFTLSEVPFNDQAVDKPQLAASTTAFFQYLKGRTIPMLGLTEPSLCAYAQARIHEKDPFHTEVGSPLSLQDTLSLHSDFVQVQQMLNHSTEVALPRMVQFELAWITEQLPQSRALASTDQQFCFFFREEAESVMLDHMQQMDQHGMAINLVWHHFHPIYDDMPIHEIGADPFAAVEDKVTNMALLQMMQHLNDEDISSLDELTQRLIQTQRAKLDRITAFVQKLALQDIQLIFRPYHEHTGHWFWWGIPALAADEQQAQEVFRQFWRHTRQYLAQQGVRNLLYAYSPDIPDQPSRNIAAFKEHYERGCIPEEIEIMGLDFYLDKRLSHPFRAADMEAVSKECLQYLQWIHELYPEHVLALTETGIRFNEYPIEPTTEADGATFWQQYFLPLIRNQYKTLPLSYMTLWRNSPRDYTHPHPTSKDIFLTEITALIDHLDTIPFSVSSTTEPETI